MIFKILDRINRILLWKSKHSSSKGWIAQRRTLGCYAVRDRFQVEKKKYSLSPLNISELYFLKCDFEHDDLGWLGVGC